MPPVKICKPRPLVTVVIPAFNAATTIERAVNSALAQNYRPIEIVVVNDASTDETAAVVTRMDRPEIRFYSLAQNLGECGAMNHAIERANGEFVAFLDADDEWREGKLEKQVDVLLRNPKMSFVSCGCVYIDRDGRVMKEFGTVLPDRSADEIWRGLLSATYIAKPCVVARRALLRSVGPFDPSLKVGGDQDMWIRLALAGEVGLVPEVLVNVYETPDSLTKKYATRFSQYVLPMIERHVRAQRHRLSDSEVRRIRGERYSWLGRNLYTSGSLREGGAYLLKAALSGHRTAENLWYIVTAAPPVRHAKAAIRRAKPVGIRSRGTWQIADVGEGPPILSVVVDAEAEFDWSGPFSGAHLKVSNLAHQEPAQRLFEKYGIRPAYLVDYAVASQADGYRPIQQFHQSGACEVGVHLQPWETPPLHEDGSEVNSFVGNLPIDLQRKKLAVMTELVERTFRLRPTMHKAGRYGLGKETPQVLAEFGYDMDLSILPATDLTPQHGPDFRFHPSRPFWLGPDDRIFELPMTVGFVGPLKLVGRSTAVCLLSPRGERLHVPGVLARLRLLERIRLSPEGMTFEDLRRLTLSLLREGHRIFSLTYHSPSLLPGCTPYVQSHADLARFMRRLERYLEFFFSELGGTALTPTQVRRLAAARKVQPASPDALRSEPSESLI